MDFDALDEDQVNVVRWSPSVDSNLRVVAAAGSGKTTTVVALIAKLLIVDEIAASDICVITFANKAAGELKQRLEVAVGAAATRQLTVGTFHAVGLNQLRYNNPSSWPMHKCMDLGPGQREKNIPSTSMMWRNAVVFGNMPGTGEESLKCADKHDAHLKHVGLQRAAGVRVHEAKHVREAPQFKLAWAMVERAKQKLGAWEFDDVLLAWHTKLEQEGGSNFRVVIVDEAQDNNKIQADITKLLAARQGKIVLIGDLRQCVHEWRGAYPHIFQNAEIELQAQTRELRFNYRSTPDVVELCNTYSAGKKWDIGSHVQATKPADSFSGVRVSAHDSSFDAGLRIAESVLTDKENGIERSRVVLCRTNGQIATIEAAFVSIGVPVMVAGQSSLFKSWEARVMVNYLKAMNENSLEALSEVLNTPKRFVSTQFAQLLKHTPRNVKEPIYLTLRRVMRSGNLKKGTENNLMELSYFLEAGCALAYKQQAHHVFQLLVKNTEDEGEVHETDTLGVLAAVMIAAERCDSYADFTAFINRAVSSNTEGVVLLSTIHKAKGLEWDEVHVDVTDGLIPHKRSVGLEIHEEERLLYVALSRAKMNLHLFYANTNNEGARAGMTRLLKREWFKPEALPELPEDNEPALPTIAGFRIASRRP